MSAGKGMRPIMGYDHKKYAANYDRIFRKPMKTLKEHNQEVLQHNAGYGQPRPNGIECQDCKAELWDSSPSITLTSNPPQKHIHCPKCGYRGYRFV